MKEKHRREYEKALRRNRNWLLGLLESPYWYEADLHLLVAARLRVLLADDNRPILLDYADEIGKNLRIWGPWSPEADLTELLFAFKALKASWEPDGEGHEMSIREYLDTDLGVASKDHGDRKEQVAYTAREIIKEAANAEGVTHLRFEKSPGLRYLKESAWHRGGLVVKEVELRETMEQLGRWTIRAIEEVLELEEEERSPS